MNAWAERHVQVSLQPATALGGSEDKGKDSKGAHKVGSTVCSGLSSEKPSCPCALAFCQLVPLSLPHTHTF